MRVSSSSIRSSSSSRRSSSSGGGGCGNTLNAILPIIVLNDTRKGSNS